MKEVLRAVASWATVMVFIFTIAAFPFVCFCALFGISLLCGAKELLKEQSR